MFVSKIEREPLMKIRGTLIATFHNNTIQAGKKELHCLWRGKAVTQNQLRGGTYLFVDC